MSFEEIIVLYPLRALAYATPVIIIYVLIVGYLDRKLKRDKREAEKQKASMYTPIGIAPDEYTEMIDEMAVS